MVIVCSCREQCQSRLLAPQRLLRGGPQVSLRQLSKMSQARGATGAANRQILSSLPNRLARGMRSNLEHGNLQAPDSMSPAFCCESCDAGHWGGPDHVFQTVSRRTPAEQSSLCLSLPAAQHQLTEKHLAQLANTHVNDSASPAQHDRNSSELGQHKKQLGSTARLCRLQV